MTLEFTGTDGDGDTVSGAVDVGNAVTLTIVDDVPVDNDDIAYSIDALVSEIDSSFVGSDGKPVDSPTASGSFSADWGADGPAAENAIKFGIAGDENSQVGFGDSNTLSINGTYGTLVVTDNGGGNFSYTYTLKENAGGDLLTTDTPQDVFTYVLTDGDGDSTEPTSLTFDIDATEFEFGPPSIDGIGAEGGDIEVYEAALENGTGKLGQNDPIGEDGRSANGAFSLNAVAGIQHFTVTGSLVSGNATQSGGAVVISAAQLADLANGDADPIVIDTQNGVLTLSGATLNEAGTEATVNYTYELTSPLDHPVENERDLLDKDGIGIELTDLAGRSDDSEIIVSVKDDIPAWAKPITGDLDVTIDAVDLDALEGAWNNIISEAGWPGSITSSQLDNGIKLSWGTPTAGSNAPSSYTFIYSNNLSTDGVVDFGTPFAIGEFTHNNFEILANDSQVLDKVELEVTFNLMINGVMTPVTTIIALDHEETPNTNPNPTAKENDDFVRISNPDKTVSIEVDGQKFTFRIRGFEDENGDLVEKVRTTETKSNSFKLFAEIVHENQPSIDGTFDASWGADGPHDDEPFTLIGANDDSVVLSDLTAGESVTVSGQYGELTATYKGNGEFSYSYVLTPEGRALIEEGAQSEQFSYILKDGDGDTRSNTLTFDLTGTPFEFEAPEIQGLESQDVVVYEAFLQQGTQSGPEEADRKAGGEMTLVAMAGVASLWVKGTSAGTEGMTGVENNGDSGYVEISVAALADSANNPVIITTAEGNILTINGYDADTGVVSYTFELVDTVNHQDGSDTDATLDKDGIDVVLVDGRGVQSEPGSINVTIVDDGVKAKDDSASVDAGESVGGDVLENDLGADRDLSLTQVAHEGTVYQFGEGADPLVIETDSGTLTINRDGSFTFAATDVTPNNVPNNNLSAWKSGTAGLWGFDNIAAALNSGALDLNALTSAAQSDVGFQPGNERAGLGVDIGGTRIGDGQGLVLQLSEEATSATATIARYNASQTDQGKWTAFDADGNEVGSGKFSGENANGAPQNLSIETDSPFSFLVFSLDTGNTQNEGYVLSGLNYVPASLPESEEFVYTAVDADGSTDEATLTINLNSPDAGAPDTPDAPLVPEVSVMVTSEVGNETILKDDFSDISGVGEAGDAIIDDPTPPSVTKEVVFDFGVENAGQQVTLSWTHQAKGGWEDGNPDGLPSWQNRGGTRDKYEVFINGDKEAEFSYYEPNNDNNAVFDPVNESYTVTLDADGKAVVEFKVTTTDPAEVVDIFDIEAQVDTTTTLYPVELSGTIEDDGEIDHYLLEVEGGALLFNGNPLVSDNGVYRVETDQLDGLTVRPDADAADINVTATAISTDGVSSEPMSSSTPVDPPVAVDNINTANISVIDLPGEQTSGQTSASSLAITKSTTRTVNTTRTIEFTVDEGSAGALNFNVSLSEPSGITYCSSASVEWRLEKEVLPGSWEHISGFDGTLSSGIGSATFEDIESGDYRVVFDSTLVGGFNGFGPFPAQYPSVNVSGVALELTAEDRQDVVVDAINGNVITDQDAQGDSDLRPANAELQILNGDTFETVGLGNTITIDGRYGSLEIQGNGEYTYTPNEEAGNIGGIETFTYQLVQPNGNQAQANLSIRIDSPDVNVLFGSDAADTLEGTSENDVIVGGAGNDTLTGGDGDDVFRWNFGDQGDSDSPTNDIVTDFGNGDNILDIADLLQGENESNIGDFVMAAQDGSDTVLYLSSDGSLAGSTDNADQTIRLEGKSFSDFGAAPGNSEELIAKMIENGQIHIDQ
ncbi:type I secretion C-terminal target domain-containing protein [Franzmannia pantelleriensis]|uniref:type I secretion C-terminal target domain-containing protein n=1 Tax=Franzmannia pantelleriensis TaxID=48727 RepID=UPI001C4098E1|nr:type I secretion C-terminal target domain-containing protein [Halomonas pantelleriensis]